MSERNQGINQMYGIIKDNLYFVFIPIYINFEWYTIIPRAAPEVGANSRGQYAIMIIRLIKYKIIWNNDTR